MQYVLTLFFLFGSDPALPTAMHILTKDQATCHALLEKIGPVFKPYEFRCKPYVQA